MKKFRIFSLSMVVLLVMCLSFTACDSGGGDSAPTYTVWIDRFPWASNLLNYGNLSSGEYKFVELSASEFNRLKDRDYYDVTEKKLTADEISKQLVSWGFDSSSAKTAANKLTSYNHAELGFRSGSYLYCILK
jgi:hypothetical protein